MMAHTWPLSLGWQAIGWTMLHFLWLGTLVAIAGALARVASRRLNPTIRYAQSLAVFATLALLPLGITIWLNATAPSTAFDTNTPPNPSTPPTKAPGFAEGSHNGKRHAGGSHSEKRLPHSEHSAAINPPVEHFSVGNPTAKPWAEMLHHVAAYLPWLWLAGTPLTFALLATGLIGTERLRRRSHPATEIITDACLHLRKSLNITRRVSIAICEPLTQPILVGIIRPLILLPPAALAGWSPEQLEMVLLHELAHVRRWDNLVNLMQRIVESLLFFHPAVWLVSRWLRRDREECCDATVVAHTAEPQAYADLLVTIAASPPPLAGLALARHPLAQRIRRILKLEDEPMLVSRSTIGMVVVTLAALLAVAIWQPLDQSVAKEKASAPTEQKESTAEDAESAEEDVRSADENVYHFNAGDPHSEIEKIIKKLKAAGLTIYIHKKDGGSISVSGIKEVPPTPATVPPAIPVFLPLKQQRAVDLAYKALGVELGQLSVDDIARAKANKFEGGLLITEGSGGSFSNVFLKGDILVGLHVWPTKSLQDVVEILQRDDIAELSPLKYFVLRRIPDNSNLSVAYKLYTGRTSVNLAAVKNKSKVQEPTSAVTRIAGPKNGLANTSLRYDGKTFDEWRMLWRTELKTERRTEAIRALAAFGRAGYGKEATEAILEVVKEYDWTFIDGSPVGNLKNTLLSAFTGLEPEMLTVDPIQLDDWLPVLKDAILSDDKRVIAFAGYVFPLSLRTIFHLKPEEKLHKKIVVTLQQIGPKAVPWFLPYLLRSDEMERAEQNADGEIEIIKYELAMTAADLLRQITGSDQAAIKYLESLVGDIKSHPISQQDVKQATRILERLKARREDGSR